MRRLSRPRFAQWQLHASAEHLLLFQHLAFLGTGGCGGRCGLVATLHERTGRRRGVLLWRSELVLLLLLLLLAESARG